MITALKAGSSAREGQTDSARIKMTDCVILGGRSHPDLLARICRTLDIDATPVDIKDFSNGETSITVKETVRDRDVFVIQSSYDHVNGQLMELLIMLSALKTASAKSITVVLPIFPYSRQSDAATVQNYATNERNVRSRYDGSVGSIGPHNTGHAGHAGNGSIGSVGTNGPNGPNGSNGSNGFNGFNGFNGNGPSSSGTASPRKASTFGEDVRNPPVKSFSKKEKQLYNGRAQSLLQFVPPPFENPSSEPLRATSLLNPEYNTGHRSWVAQNGPIVASLLATAGADHVITMDLHDPQFQGFFDVPFDNLLFRPLLFEYIKTMLPTYHSAVIVSPDAGGATRATTVADQLHTRFALIHQDRRNSATILVGDVNDRVAVLIDDMVDTGATLIRAAKLLKDHGAVQVYAICTHGVFSGDTVYKVRDSAIDFIVTTNSVPQDAHQAVLGSRLHVVDISVLFAEAIRRIRNGESISRLYNCAPGAL